MHAYCEVAVVTLSNQPFWSMCCRMSSMAVWVSYLSTKGMLMSSTKYTRRFDPGGPYFVPAPAKDNALRKVVRPFFRQEEMGTPLPTMIPYFS